ncbi:HTH-type transcriptional regulator GltC [Paraconexibacter sp. AEG42_29]|uniref:HTH-type transcriptional regulator GltC n=1 Tax=Paraconexibacter sp. AEG42_29 TaxID=2997339 RepID=A0AAU7AQ57_9ACTN
MLHLGRLRTLREVADRGTIAAAADALHLTPSAVSQQLSALEREIGHRLVEKDGRTIRLTPLAEVLVRRADAVFAEVQVLQAEVAAHAAGEQARLHVAAFATAITSLIAPAAIALRESSPGLELRVTMAEAPEAFAGLGRQELDIVISMEASGAPTHDDPRFAREELLTDVLDLVVPAGHPLAGAGPVPLTAAGAERWVVPPGGWTCEQVVVGACHAAGFTPRVAHRSADWNAVMALVAAGLGVALVPRLARTAIVPGAVVVPVEGTAPARHLFVACRRGHQDAPALRRTIDALHTAARGTVGHDAPVMLAA